MRTFDDSFDWTSCWTTVQNLRCLWFEMPQCSCEVTLLRWIDVNDFNCTIFRKIVLYGMHVVPKKESISCRLNRHYNVQEIYILHTYYSELELYCWQFWQWLGADWAHIRTWFIHDFNFHQTAACLIHWQATALLFWINTIHQYQLVCF